MSIKKKLILHDIYTIENNNDFDRSSLKFLDRKILRDLTILKKVDIVIDIVDYIINQIYSNGIDIKIFKSENNKRGKGKEVELEEDIEYELKRKETKNGKIDILGDDLFPTFETFRTKEMETERRWITFYRDLIANFLIYGFAVIKYKQKDDNLLIPEI